MNICKGCPMDNISNQSCIVKYALNADKCPCTTCLVKTMCKHPCEAEIELEDLSYKKRGFKGVK